MPDFFMRTRRGGGYTQIFGMYSKNTGDGGGGGAMLKILCVTKATSY